MFSIAPIPYLQNGIPGFLTKHQLEIHVTKHHQAYVDFANKNVPGSEFDGKTIEEIIQTSSGPIFNNVAQHYNHSFFWQCLSGEKLQVSEQLNNFFEKYFKGIESFKSEFTQKASTIFGSGWCYLAVNKDGSVSINQYSNAANPVKDGGFPILCVDTWEHAWYIDYENRKAEYFAKYWDAVNWDFVEKRLKEIKMI
ncbi:iron superoxide dismutase [Histomonas meleagridis]|uniref:iron superoxide dismutase n=1 Tax=Histomonas meleagridis TaxID=135588 RepID=UPI00355A1F20|nr:iron superoxide dismutase [Histomonas meleagridis]KAH0799860.1 iron superoxide dismutase [Histomonas meleagridis]